MEIGTAESFEEKKRKLKRRMNLSRSSGFGSDGGNNGDDGDNGGDDRRDSKKDHIEDEISNPEAANKSRILMIFLLLVVLMTFGGLVSAYVVISTNAALEWKPFAGLPYQVWISTFILLASSFTYYLAKSALLGERETRARKWFLITTGLGGLFISSQLLVWLALLNRGYYMTGNPYAGFFYILTAVHAIHVIGGIFALGYIILRTWNTSFSDLEIIKRKNDAVAVGWYWHTMDGLWIVIVLLLGFYK